MTDGVTITLDEMYEVLQRLDRTLTESVLAHASYNRQLLDHELRLRVVEADAATTQRVRDLETAIDDLRKRVWAIPGISVVIAAVAVGVTLSR